ncbi:MAG: PIG-L family deacetylase [Granulosicoccus sp.]
MPSTASQRIDHQLKTPRHVALWRALQPLKSCVSFMNTGAHPDDETSAMLSMLSLRHGLDVSFACANRGEGGQNDIGTEVSEDLGVVRTAEMEQAAIALDINLYWLSESPGDSIFDFGFSKSGQETLRKWGHKRTLERMVAIIREERPDIVCTTFLDVPGQHGHHRAMTQIVQEAIAIAADSSVISGEHKPWQVRKCYLPAWSGAGDSYDDDLPPPPATLELDGQGEDPVTGWTYEQMGQHSRYFHKTQGMGKWVPHGAERNWPLHLVQSTIETDDVSITSGLPADLGELAAFANAGSIETALQTAQAAMNTALESFPDCVKVRIAAGEALVHVRDAQRRCPESAHDEVLHRLAKTERQLSRVILLASRVFVHGTLNRSELRIGDEAEYEKEVFAGDANAVSVELLLDQGWQQDGERVCLMATAELSNAYPSRFLPQEPEFPALRVTVDVDGNRSETLQRLHSTPLCLPAVSARLSPHAIVINKAVKHQSLELTLSEQFPSDAEVVLDTPDAWRFDRTATGFSVTPPDKLEIDRHHLSLVLDNQQASSVSRFDYPHIASRARITPAGTQVQIIDAALSDTRIGYVGGGNDNVLKRLIEMGCKARALDDDELENGSGLDSIDTLLVGVFAVRTRQVLQDNLTHVHRWVERGGNLVTLYHRPWDAWNPDKVPPLPLTIGKPSLRFRVTDENAEVTHLLTDHRLLNYPNKITSADWQGWHKERGLYFAKSWDPAYEALLSMADPDEDAHTGALLCARIGRGRHTHTSLILHHQMEKLIPGAYRIMANLVAKVE